jgi:ribosomal protein S18 acetylase RimI-like enzyme
MVGNGSGAAEPGEGNQSTTGAREDRPVRDATNARVRPYRETDRDWLIAMYEAYDESQRTLGTPPESHEEIVAWLDGLVGAGTNWVAIADSTGVGHAVVVPISEARGELSVYVHPDHFDRGIGTRLCSHAIEAAAGEYETLWLVVERSNSRAVSVFKKVGFEVADYHRSDIEMVYEDT